MGIVAEVARTCHRQSCLVVSIVAFAIVLFGSIGVYFIYASNVSSGKATYQTKLLHEGEAYVVAMPEQTDATGKVTFGRVKGTGRYCVTGPLVDYPSQITSRWRCDRSYSFSSSSSSPVLAAWYMLPGSSIDMEFYHWGTLEAAVVLTEEDAQNWANFRPLSRPQNLLWSAAIPAKQTTTGNATIGTDALPEGKYVHTAHVVVRNVTDSSQGNADISATFASAYLQTTKCSDNGYMQPLQMPYTAGGLYAFVKTPPEGYHRCAGKAEHQFSISIPHETTSSKFIFAVPFLLAAAFLLSWYLCSKKARALNAPALDDVSIDQSTDYQPMKSTPEGF